MGRFASTKTSKLKDEALKPLQKAAAYNNHKNEIQPNSNGQCCQKAHPQEQELLSYFSTINP
jgi:hypothetical protein